MDKARDHPKRERKSSVIHNVSQPTRKNKKKPEAKQSSNLVSAVNKTRKTFLAILSSLKFRPEYDIDYRISCLPMFNQEIELLKKKYSDFLNDEREAAIILTGLSRKARSHSRSRSRSEKAASNQIASI
jgi:hypothetical protein